MASYGDNKPVFRSRAAAAGLSDDFVQLLVDSHLDSLSKYAFCSSYVPGSGDDASFIRAIRNAIGRDPLIGEQASCRKLLHEAYALVTAEIKQQLERSEEVQTRKLTQPERSDLYQKQVKKLVGLSLKGPMEPSDALVDVFGGMYDANRLRFVPWEKYTSKECELEKSARVEHQFAVEGSGKLRVESKVPESAADTSSEILLQYALQRRGLSMEQANLLDYVIHQTWVDKLIRTRLQTPPDGYARVSFKQLLEADKKLFEELCDETRAGVQATAAGRPLDLVFSQCRHKPEVLHLLQPLPTRPQSTAPPKDDKFVWNRFQPYSKSKGKGKDKGKGKGFRMPVQLVEGGCRPTTNQGDPICYGYNLGRCTLKVNKGRCEKGFHVCALPKCGKHHPFIQCPAKGSAS